MIYKTDSEFFRGLLKLSGMAHSQGKYTPVEWQAKTGINPANSIFKGFIEVTPKNDGLCIWTRKAEQRLFHSEGERVRYDNGKD